MLVALRLVDFACMLFRKCHQLFSYMFGQPLADHTAAPIALDVNIRYSHFSVDVKHGDAQTLHCCAHCLTDHDIATQTCGADRQAGEERTHRPLLLTKNGSINGLRQRRWDGQALSDVTRLRTVVLEEDRGKIQTKRKRVCARRTNHMSDTLLTPTRTR